MWPNKEIVAPTYLNGPPCRRKMRDLYYLFWWWRERLDIAPGLHWRKCVRLTLHGKRLLRRLIEKLRSQKLCRKSLEKAEYSPIIAAISNERKDYSKYHFCIYGKLVILPCSSDPSQPLKTLKNQVIFIYFIYCPPGGWHKAPRSEVEYDIPESRYEYSDRFMKCSSSAKERPPYSGHRRQYVVLQNAWCRWHMYGFRIAQMRVTTRSIEEEIPYKPRWSIQMVFIL